MSRIAVLSGKGGTGKTSLASAWIKLGGIRTYGDCDVDAPNLHLVVPHGEQVQRWVSPGLPKARIVEDRCSGCGLCHEVCRYDAVEAQGLTFTIRALACEGCALCAELCPEQAIELDPHANADLELHTGGRVFSTATLRVGTGTCGLVVSQVKQLLESSITDDQVVIYDGSPGIGCPVMATIAGVDLVALVAEPTVSGLADVRRIHETATGLNTPSALVVNKWDLNPELTDHLEAFAAEHHVPVLGRIPYDPTVGAALDHGRTLLDVGGPVAAAVTESFRRALSLLHLAPT